MTFNFFILLFYIMSSVILEPQFIDVYHRQNKEPQYITSKVPNRGIIYIDSQQNTLQTDPTNMIISTVRRLGDSAGPLALNINRIGINGFNLFYNSPNVNPRNNTITIWSSVHNAFFTTTVEVGWYANDGPLQNAIVAALNNITGATGLTFNHTNIVGFPFSFLLESTGGDYYILNTCTAITRGFQLWNLANQQTPSNSKICGPVEAYYTKYVDICSSTLTKYSKVKTVSNNLNNNIIFRIFLGTSVFPHVTFHENTDSVSYNWNPNEPITYIDFQLKDMFGEYLYLHPSNDQSITTCFWDCNLTIET
jgi:hypothetical protein